MRAVLAVAAAVDEEGVGVCESAHSQVERERVKQRHTESKMQQECESRGCRLGSRTSGAAGAREARESRGSERRGTREATQGE